MSKRGTVGIKENGLVLELPGGVDEAGINASPAPLGRARLRYNDVTKELELSVDESAYVAIGTGGGGSPWVEAAGVVRLQNIANTVVVGAVAPAGAEKMRIVGDTRIDSSLFVSEVSTAPASGTDLDVTSDGGGVNVIIGGTDADAFNVSDATGQIVTADLSGGSRDLGFGVGVPLDAVRSFSDRAELQVGVDAAAFEVSTAADTFINLDTTPASENMVFGGNSVIAATQTIDADGIVFGVPDDSATAFSIAEGANEYFAVVTSNGAERAQVGDNAVLDSGIVFVPSGADLRVPDNSPSAWTVSEGGNQYVVLDTSNGSESIQVGGNAIFDSGINLSATGVTITVPDNVASAYGVSEGANGYLGVDTTNGSESVTIGNATTNPTVMVVGTGDVSIEGAVCLPERAGDPGAVADNIKLYSKEVAGVTELFTVDSAGNTAQITSGGSVVAAPAGANTQVQFNNAGVFGASANFTWTGTALVVGTSGTRATVSVNIADNTANAFQILEGVNTYFNVITTNGSEVVGIGNNTTLPRIQMNTALVTAGSAGVARVNLTEIGPSAFETVHAVSIGIRAECTALTLGQSALSMTSNAGDNVFANGPLSMTERVGDPGATANRGKAYTKDVATITELFYQDSAGNVVQITSGGSVLATASPGGATTQIQFNNAGVLDGDARLTFNDATGELAFTGAVIDLDPTGDFTVDIGSGQTMRWRMGGGNISNFVVQNASGTQSYFRIGGAGATATEIHLGNTNVASPRTNIQLPDANAIAFTVERGAGGGDFINVDTGGTPSVDFGNALDNPAYIFLGSGTMRLDGDINFVNLGVALGGGVAPTLGTIGGGGPATAAQDSWLAVKIGNVTSFLAVWR